MENIKNLNQCIIIGGGDSINNLIKLGLWGILKNTFTIGCNFSYKDFTPTALCCVDPDFYIGKIDQVQGLVHGVYEINPVHVKKLRELPLIITQKHPKSLRNDLQNTLFLKTHADYWFGAEMPSKGFYRNNLSGVFATTIASYLLDFKGEVILLGFDWTRNGDSHYYNHSIHKGTQNNHYYEHKINGKFVHNPDEIFSMYLKNTETKIYNASLNSNINVLPKISPEECIKKIQKAPCSQEALRTYIKSKLHSAN